MRTLWRTCCPVAANMIPGVDEHEIKAKAQATEGLAYRPGRAEIEEHHGSFAIGCYEGALTTDLPIVGDLVWLFEDPPYPSRLFVNTGGQTGPFTVRMELGERVADPPGSEWEDIAEVSISCTGPLVATAITDTAPEAWIDCAGGQYRLRISARGRAEGRRRDRECDWVDEAVEHYLIQAWPAPPTASAVVRTSAP